MVYALCLLSGRAHSSTSPAPHQEVLWMSQTKLIFSQFVCLKNGILVSECLEDMRLVKNWPSMYCGDDGAIDLGTICDHIHFFRKD